MTVKVAFMPASKCPGTWQAIWYWPGVGNAHSKSVVWPGAMSSASASTLAPFATLARGLVDRGRRLHHELMRGGPGIGHLEQVQLAGLDLGRSRRDREIAKLDRERRRGGRHDGERGGERRLSLGAPVIGHLKIPRVGEGPLDGLGLPGGDAVCHRLGAAGHERGVAGTCRLQEEGVGRRIGVRDDEAVRLPASNAVLAGVIPSAPRSTGTSTGAAAAVRAGGVASCARVPAVAVDPMTMPKPSAVSPMTRRSIEGAMVPPWVPGDPYPNHNCRRALM